MPSWNKKKLNKVTVFVVSNVNHYQYYNFLGVSCQML